MASRFDEGMAFLLGPNVILYGNSERAAVPCPACGALQGKPCEIYRKAGTKRNEPHEERRNLQTPRSEDEVLEILEKLARKYARAHNPLESFGPARYPRC